MNGAAGRSSASGSLRPHTAVALAVVAALIVFLPVPGGGFVYDDHRFLAANPGLASVDVLWRAFLDPTVQTADASYAGLWRPVRTLSFAVDRLFFGDAAWGPHLVNLLLHGLQSALVTLWLLRLRLPPVAALAGALVFALHPVQVESVAWISSRGDLLALCGVLGAIVLHVDGRVRSAWLVGGLALLSKEQAVVWAPLLAITLRARHRGLGEIARAVAVPSALTVGFVLVRHLLLAEPLQEGGVGNVASLSDLFAMVGHQAWTTVLPVGGHFDWQMPTERPVALLLVGLLALATPLVERVRLPALWFHVALVPTLYVQAVVPLNIRVADRFLLFALPALSWLVAVAVRRDRRVWLPLGAVLLGLATTTAFRTPDWRDDGTLWRSVVAAEPDHWRANAHLGVEAYEAGEYQRAREHFRRAVDSTAGRLDGQTRFRHGVVLELLGVRAGPETEAGRSLFTRALAEYEAAVAAYSSRRSEGTGDLPLARLAGLHLAYVVSGGRSGAEELRAWIAGPPPRLDEARRAPWTRRVGQFVRALRAAGRPALAQDLRQWGQR